MPWVDLCFWLSSGARLGCRMQCFPRYRHLGRKLEFGIGRFIFIGVPPILFPLPFSMSRNAVSAATTGGTHEIAD